MNKKVIAIVGTYRKGKVIDSIVTEVLRGAEEKGCTTEKIYLIDKHLEFCTNCRTCTQEENVDCTQSCIHKDDMCEILQKIKDADCIVMASPVNFGTVTAVMKKFVERLIATAYWPWTQPAPKLRVKDVTKKAVLVSATACPKFIAKATFMYNSCFSVMKKAARCLGAKVVNKMALGFVATSEDGRITESDKQKAYKIGSKLAA